MIKTINIVYESVNDLIKAKSQIGTYDQDKVLIQVFTANDDVFAIGDLQKIIKKVFPSVQMIGVTTSGEIIDGQSLEGKTVISITKFEQSIVKTVFVDYITTEITALEEKADAVGISLQADDLKAVILFVNSVSEEESFLHIMPFMKRLKQIIPEAIIAGGGAGNYYVDYFHKTTVFTEEKLTQHGVVLAGLYGAELSAINKENLSWVPIGKKLMIQDVDGFRLKQIDDLKPLEIFREYLGDEIAKGLPLTASEFPFILERAGYEILVHPVKIHPNGDIDFSHELHAGETVRFSYCHVGLLSLSAHNMYMELVEEDIQTNFVYSCAVRKSILGEDIIVELSPLAKLSPSIGFFSFGEYFDEGFLEHHRFGQIMSVIGLREGEVKKKMDFDERTHDKGILSESRQFRTMRVMHRLIDKSARDLEMALTSLSQLAHKDALTGLYNRGYFDKYFKRMINDHNRSGAKMAIILLDVDYFKFYNDTYGHVSGDDVLRGIGHCLMTSVSREGDVVSRYGGEEFAVILPSTDLEGARLVAENIRQSIMKLKIPHKKSKVAPVITVSVGYVCINQESRKDFSDNMAILEACDQCLYEAKEKGRNRVVGKEFNL